MQIAVGTVVYIDEKVQLPELEKFLQSVTDFYPVIVVNGKWQDFEGTSGRSIPEVSELISSFSNTIEIEYPNHSEAESRNQYMIMAGRMGCDAILTMDTDEHVTGNKDEFIKNAEVLIKKEKKMAYRVTVNSERSGGDHWPSKFVLNPAFCRYRQYHNQIFFNDKDVLQDVGSVINGLKLMEDRTNRSKSMIKRMVERNVRNPQH